MFLFVTDTIENYELEDYIEEILFNEFDTMVEDGSLSKVRIELLLPNLLNSALRE